VKINNFFKFFYAFSAALRVSLLGCFFNSNYLQNKNILAYSFTNFAANSKNLG